MSEPLFDQSFYDYFAENTHTRLTDAVKKLQSYRDGSIDRAATVAHMRHLLHNVAGEARMLDLPDIGRLVMRLSHRLGRPGAPGPAMGPQATQHLMHCCELLSALVKEEVKQRDRPAALPRQALAQELARFEAEP